MAEHKQTWGKVLPAPLVLLSGPEDVIARSALARVRAVCRTSNPSLEINELDASTYRSGTLLTMASPSLFAEPRLLVIEHGETMNDAFLTDAVAYASDPQPDAVVVLRHRKGVRGKRALSAWRAAGCTTVTCAALKRPAERAEFITELVAARGRVLQRPAVQQLAEIFATDTAQLLGAVDQLLQDVEGIITPDDVSRYFGTRGETSGFAIADAALGGAGPKALLLLRRALDDGIAPILVLSALTSKVRLVAAVHGVRGSAGALAGKVGAAPWQIERAIRESRAWDESALAQALQEVARTDASLKSGARDPAYRLERLVRMIADRGQTVRG
ncbi:MAG: DNA polymerase III subunit delta [Microbacteriaceae bacterium]|jgi:DNA polymerase-3 subunit delta|nr:DNA polymerase III subunit delta [Microbacteriaceae bacterium]